MVPNVAEIAVRLHSATGKPMGWCMNEAVRIVREWAIAKGLAD